MERQVGQRRRWREGRYEGDGGLAVQFCIGVNRQRWLKRMKRRLRRGSGGRKEGKGRHTRHTIRPHLRQSLTRSLAHADTLPDTRCPASPSICHFCPVFSFSDDLASRNSFSQRSVCCTRRLRYWRRLARIWRHVRERASRVFRSTLWAIWVTILGGNVSPNDCDGKGGMPRAGGRTDRRPKLLRGC